MAAPARNILHSYVTLGSTSLSLSQPYILSHLSLGRDGVVVGAIAAKTSLDHLFVQHKCTVLDEFNGNNLQLP